MNGPNKMIDKKGVAQAEKPNIFLEEMAVKVRQLPPPEAAERFKESGLSISDVFLEEAFPKKRTFEINGRVYGVAVKKGSFELRADPKIRDLTVLKAYIFLVDSAVDKFSKMVESYDRKEFPLVIASKPKSYVAGTYPLLGEGPFPSVASTIEVNKEELIELSNIPRNKSAASYPLTASTLKKIETDLLHELIHDFRARYFESRRENLSLLGDFLRDPAANWDYNNFRDLSLTLRYDPSLTKEEFGFAKMFNTLRNDPSITKEQLEWLQENRAYI